VPEEGPQVVTALDQVDHAEWSSGTSGQHAGLSSLDLIGRTVVKAAQGPFPEVSEDLGPVPPELTGSVCPRCNWHWLNVETGEVIPGRCRASFCTYCGPYEAWWKARIVSAGGASGPPQRFMVGTLAPERWSSLRQKVRDLRRELVQEGVAWEQAWTVELGGKTAMRHVNFLQKGDYVAQAELQRLWGAIVHVSAVHDVEKASEYALKEARTVTGYALKEAGKGLEEHLAINGWRLVHLSRNYLGGMTQAEVRKQFLQQSDEELGQWVRRAGKVS
jgi:hypothetical protein